ncbi:MAG: type 4a pilus biogenesis protein PilO [Smithellaceae bacterium]|nr:type 4a pilus biogenesis protein PilO [Smithellaceae bacterium]
MKALIVCLAYLVLGYFYFFFVLQSSVDKMTNLRAQSADLEQQVTEKRNIVAQLPVYKKQVEFLKGAFQEALAKLPVQKEIPGLLSSVALAGRSAGVEFLLFEPQAVKKEEKPAPGKPAPGVAAQKPEEKKPAGKSAPPKPAEEKFYEEIPVKLIVQGSFNQTATFFEKVGKLPRIINLEDIDIEQSTDLKKPKGQVLKTTCTLKTYMFVQNTGESKKADEKNRK